MTFKLSLFAGATLAALALLLLFGAADGTSSTRAQSTSFNPTLGVAIANPEPETPSDFTVDFGLPSGDVNFAAVIAFIPADWGVVPGDEIPVGTEVGSLTSEATLGLINGACNNSLTVEFTFMNSSLDVTDTVSFYDTNDSGAPDFTEDADGNTIPDGVDKYPDFITRILADEEGNPLQPYRRSAGITVVAGIPVFLQFLIFEPGTVISPALPSDPELGYPSVTLLQNIGDPDLVPAPGAITDFCTPLTSANTSLGTAEDGTPLFINPQDGTYTFTTIALGQRDADGDGFENALDTCPFDPNVGDPRIQGDGDADDDGLDAACDPNDNETNSDEDGDGYLNRQDNCPLVPNGENEDNQADADSDQIGDACDPDPDCADCQGELSFAQLTQDVTIGDGTGDGGPPEGFPRFEVPGDDNGGLSTGALIGIIVGIIAVAIVLGVVVFALARRGGGGAPAG